MLLMLRIGQRVWEYAVVYFRSRNGVRLYLFLLSFVRRLIFSYIWLRRTYFRSEMKRKTSFPFAFCSLILRPTGAKCGAAIVTVSLGEGRLHLENKRFRVP